MSYPLTSHNFNYWIELLARMKEANDNSGMSLRDDLKAALETANGAFKNLVNNYKSLRAQEKQFRKQAAALQKQGRRLLNKAKYALVSSVPEDKLDFALQLYQFHRPLPVSRVDAIAGLRIVTDAAAQQQDDDLKLRDDLKNEIAQAYTDLNGKFEQTNAVRADIEESRRKLREAILENVQLRERIYAFLVSVLDGGSRDPKLIDYGLRENFRVGRRGQVTVVDETVTPQPEPEPVQPE